MSEPTEFRIVEPARPTGSRVGVADLFAFALALLFVAGVVLLIDPAGSVSARLMLAGAAGLVGACLTAWRRLRHPKPRRWRCGQVAYRGKKVAWATAWGVEGQSPPQIEPPAGPPLLPPGTPEPPTGRASREAAP